MIQANEIAAAFGLPCLLSGDMQTALQLWEDLYQNHANWQKERVKPLRLPAMIARELKRLTLTEFVLDTKDTELQLPLQHTKQMLRQKLDYGIASGGLLLKPRIITTGCKLISWHRISICQSAIQTMLARQ